MNQQDWYLTKCGITQYVLRNSTAFKGELTAHINSQIRLIVVSETKPTEKIYSDILNAIALTEQQVLCLTPSQLIMPAADINVVTWFIDTEQPLPWQNKPLVIATCRLDKLAHSPNEKRQLWQQLCQYEHNFHPNAD